MTKKFSILQKKLQELESQLNEALSLPPNSPYHKLYNQDIEQRILFLRNLLSAEITSSPEKPHHLNHIAKRLSELEAAFYNRDNDMSLAHVETAFSCSCTESCLNDDKEEGETEPVLEMENVDDFEEKSGVKRQAKGVGFCGSFYGGLVSGMVIGMVLMGFLLVRFCGCFSYSEHALCLAAT